MLAPPWVSLKMDFVEGFEVSLWGITLVAPRGSLKKMLWRDFEVSLWGCVWTPVGVFEKDDV